MRSQHTHSADVLFSLVCSDCRIGADTESIDQAIAEGWTEIDYAPHRSTANFVGLCPECRETFGHWPTSDHQNEG